MNLAMADSLVASAGKGAPAVDTQHRRVQRHVTGAAAEASGQMHLENGEVLDLCQTCRIAMHTLAVPFSTQAGVPPGPQG